MALASPLAVSVCIVTWNVRTHLQQCLTHLRDDFAAFDLEVVLVDNHSEDGSAAMVRTSFPHVRLIENASNAGFAQAANQALRAARHATVWLLNPDTLPNPEALASMVATLTTADDIGLVGCLQRARDGSALPSLPADYAPFRHAHGPMMRCALALLACWLFPRTHPYFTRAQQRLETALNLPDEIHPIANTVAGPVAVLSGCTLVFTKDWWHRIGGFDERFFFMQEDVDLSLRARAAGYRLLLCTDAYVIHYVNQSLNALPPSHRLPLLTRTRYQLIRKHCGRRALSAWIASLLLTRAVVRSVLMCVPSCRRLRVERDAVQALASRCEGIDGFGIIRNYLGVLHHPSTPKPVPSPAASQGILKEF